MAQFETWLLSDIKCPVTVKQLSGNLFSADNMGNLVGVKVVDGGEPAELEGNVTAYIIRGDQKTVVINGELEGNKAWVILPASAYVVVGRISIVIKVGETTVGACTGNVYKTTTDEIVDPGHVIPSLAELLALIEECKDARDSANDAATLANSKAELADEKATLADDKATLANTAAGTANDAADLAVAKAGLANDAATLANSKAALANEKAELADTKAGVANDAAELATASATAADNAATAANNAASAANTAAGKINNMTVAATGLAAGASPTATISEVSGHKHILFGIPKGDKGNPGKDFHIARTFVSVSAMEAYDPSQDPNPLEDYDFVMIDTGSVEDPETGRLYCYEPENDPIWRYIGDLSGAQGIQGPQGETGETGNGIASTTLNNDYTLTILYTDGTSETTESIRGETGNGISGITLNNDYTLTISYTDGTSYTTTSIRGATGATGATGNGISSAVLNNDYTLTINFTDGTSYTTIPIRGATGATGNGIASTVMNSDYTLTITFTDGTSYTTDPIRGATGATGNGISSTVLNNDYTLTITFTDGTSYTTTSIRGATGATGETGATGATGNGISSTILNADYTLTITMTDGTSYTTDPIRGATGITPDFTIGTVTTIEPDQQASATITGTAEAPILNLWLPKGQTGTVDNLYATNIPMSSSDQTTIAEAIGDKANSTALADAFDATETYNEGDKVSKDGNVYVRKSWGADTPVAEVWDATHWDLADPVQEQLDDKLDKYYNYTPGLDGSLSTKTWTGLTVFSGNYIWTDGENIYYSSTSDQYVLDKSTLTWTTKTWTGLTYAVGQYVWTDGENIYYSMDSTQYILDKSTSTWTTKTWNGLTSFHGYNIWTDGENIYYSSSSTQYVLDKSTSTWSTKTWTGLTSFNGQYVWTDGENIYYSSGSTQYILDKSTSTWSTKTWIGLTSFSGSNVWTDGENIYYSSSSTQYVLDKSTSTWSTKTWTGYTSFNGEYVWTDGENIYYSGGSIQYVFNTDHKEKIYFGADGVFEAVPSSSDDLPFAKKRDTVLLTTLSLGRTANSTVGQNSVATGYNVTASGNYSHAEGYGTKATSLYTHAEGYYTTASGNYSHAEGANTRATGSYSHAEGEYTYAAGANSHAEGLAYSSTSTDYGALGKADHAEGYKTKANSGTNSGYYGAHAEGSLTQATNNAAHAEGYYTTASGLYSHAEGYGSKATAAGAHAEGYYTTASGSYSHAEGYYTTASGSYSHANGYYTRATGSYSHAEGQNTYAAGVNSHAEGLGYSSTDTTYGALGKADHAEGYRTKANSGTSSSYYGAHAEGNQTQATNEAAHAEGYYTTASGQRSHAEGSNTKATSSYTHAEGYYTTASNTGSHAEGGYTVASGTYAHSEGYYTTASGAYSHAEGSYSTAFSDYSHAEGFRTIAAGRFQHVVGSGNIEDPGTYIGDISDPSVVEEFDPTKKYYPYGSVVKYDNTVFVSHEVAPTYMQPPKYDSTNWHAYSGTTTGEEPEWELTTYAANTIVKYTENSVVGYYQNHNAITSTIIYPSSSAPASYYWHTQSSGNMTTQTTYEIVGGGTRYYAKGRNIRKLDFYGNEYLQGDVYVGCADDSTGGTKLAKVSEIPDISGKLDASQKGAVNGVAELDSAGKVPSSQLPSYVDDVEEYASLSNFPATGESGKIYIALDTNITYRWGGSAYVPIGSDLALGETSTTAYRGDRGKAAYDHATDSSRLTTATESGLYKVAVTAEGHVASAAAVQKSDITALGIPGQDTQYSDMTGASASAAGAHGLVPAPSAGDEGKFLRGDGTWAENTSTEIYPVTFSIATTDWTQSSGVYTASVTSTAFESGTSEIVQYDSSILNLNSGLTVAKDTTTYDMVFTTKKVPSGTITGTILSMKCQTLNAVGVSF